MVQSENAVFTGSIQAGSGYEMTVWDDENGNNVYGVSREDTDESGDTDEQNDFWKEVRGAVESADSGRTVQVNAKSYDKMPVSVMKALRENPGGTLVIEWAGGDTVTIPAGKALAAESGRVYYPISYLAEQYKNAAAAAPANGINPSTGGPIYIEARTAADTMKTVTPASEGFGTVISADKVQPAAPAENGSAAAQRNGFALLVGAALAAAALAAGSRILKKKRTQK